MSIYVDSKEDYNHHWVSKLQHLGIEAKSAKNLPTDFLWTCPAGVVRVERKTWPDFVDSMVGKGNAHAGSRLVGQLIDGMQDSSVRVLFMEGPLPPFVDTPSQMITADQMDDALVSMQWQFGVIVAHSINLEHTAQRMSALYRYTQKETHTELLRPKPPTPIENIYMNPMFRRRVAAAMCAPGLGEKGALILPDWTGSLVEAINMEQEKLLQIPGIGKGRAAQWREFWHGEW